MLGSKLHLFESIQIVMGFGSTYVFSIRNIFVGGIDQQYGIDYLCIRRRRSGLFNGWHLKEIHSLPLPLYGS